MSATHGSSLLPATGLVTDRAGGRRRLRATLAERAPTGRHTFGLYRAEVLAAFVNAQVLLLMALFIGYEAVRRLTHPVPIQAGLMLAIGTTALVGNIVSVLLLARGRNANLNMRA